MALVVVEKILEMFVILIGGVIVYRCGLIDSSTTNRLSGLLLMFVSPLLIFQSYQIDFEMQLFYGLLWTLAASFLTFLLCILLAEGIYREKDGRACVEKVASVYSNCGFIGIPLIQGILGAEGVFYMTAYTTVFNLLLWTHGVWCMGALKSMKKLWKNLLTPSIVAVFLGMAVFFAQIRLPEVLYAPFNMIAGMNTPLAMIVAGASLAQGNLLKSLKNTRLYGISLVKLVVFPLAGLVLLVWLPLDFEVAFTVFIALSCPAGATAIMFAERYGKDAYYASEIFIVTTVFAAVTIPLLSLVAIPLLQ